MLWLLSCFKKIVIFYFIFYTSRFEEQFEFLLSTLSSSWHWRLNPFEKARFLEILRKILWNLDNTSISNELTRACTTVSAYYGNLMAKFLKIFDRTVMLIPL